MARSCTRPWLPHPQMVAIRDAGRARYFAATAVAAPVRRMVISIESITARGRPFSPSQSTIKPWMEGKPDRRGLSGKFPFTLAANELRGPGSSAALT